MIKNILWIDDFDNREAGNDEPGYYDRQVEIQFGNKYKNFVQLERKVYRKDDEDEYVTDNLFESFDEHLVEIDCVVLDVNMIVGMPEGKSAFEEMTELFKKGGVLLGEDLNEARRKGIREKGGFYLYLYLLHKGFPCDRIFMNTAYADDGSFSECKEKFENAGIKFPPYVSNPYKNNNEHLCLCGKKIDELGLYSGENEYYLVRRIVFSAIEYYKNKLDEKPKKALDPFNGNMKKELTNVEMYDIFENIKLNFPQRLPKDCGSVYITALKLISGPFESKTKRESEANDGFGECYAYQRVTKTLRNWLAHNKFDSVPNQNEFLILFIVALRSYFGTDPVDDGNKTENFETSAFELIKYNNKNMNTVNRYMRSYVLLSDVCRNKKTLSLDYIEYLDRVKGWDDRGCKYSDLLKGLWVWKYNFYINFRSKEKLDPNKGGMPVYMNSKEKKTSPFGDELMTAIEAEVFSEESAATNPGELLHR